MIDSIASTEFSLLDTSGVGTLVRVELGRPFLAPGDEWACELSMLPLAKETVRGEDSFQALSLALRHIGQVLGTLRDKGAQILWPDVVPFPLEAYIFLPTPREEYRTAELERPRVAQRLLGRWEVTEGGGSDRIPKGLTGFIEFHEDDSGALALGSLSARLDYRWVSPLSDFTVRFTWQGFDGAEAVFGRGRTTILLDHVTGSAADSISARLIVHFGREAAFFATRVGS